MKKTISFTIVFLMLLSTISFGVSAEPKPFDYYDTDSPVVYDYDETTKTITISGNGEYFTDQGDNETDGCGGSKFEACSNLYPYRNKAEKVVFEEGVVNVGGASFSRFSKLKTVVLPETITKIEPYAFERCTALEEIVLPNSLKKIGFEAFASCRNLKVLNIPKDVEEISNNFIFDTPNLETLTVDPENKHFQAVDNVMYNKDMTKLIVAASKQETVEIPATVTEISPLSFALSNVKTIVIPNSVEILGGGAFFKSKLEEITFEETSKVKSIANFGAYYGDEAEEYYGAFEDCIYLKKLVLPDSVTAVGNRALGGCKSLEYLYIGKNLKNFGGDNFYDCAKLNKIKVHKENKNFFTYKGGFYDKNSGHQIFLRLFGSRKNVKIKQGTRSVDSFAFANTKVEKVTIPKTVTGMGSAIFYNAKNLKSVKFAKSIKLKYLGWDYVSFYYGFCRYEKPEFENMAMFYNCNKLKSVSFPDSLVAIEGRVFVNCKKLKSIHFGKKFNSDGGHTSYSNYFKYFMKKCPKIKNITFSKQNKNYTSKKGVIYNKDKTKVYFKIKK